jgi:BASS family bile acid:Na+ symporter
MPEIVSSLTSAFTLAFVVTSMFGLGLGLTVQQIVEPLKDVRLVLLALLANFVIVPGVAFALTRLLPLVLPFDQDLQIGLLLLSAVAGAPLTLKAAQIARGNVLFSISLVTLQVVVTVFYLPLVLPLFVPGIEVDVVAVALPLVLQILLPLAMGLIMNVRYDEEAEMARPIMGEIANISLAVMLVLNLGNIGSVLGLLGTGTLTAVLLLLAVGFGVGYLFGDPDVGTRKSLSLGTAQRNYAAAFVLATGSFAARPTVFLMLLAASLISMGVLMVVAGEFGRRAKAAEAAEAAGVAEAQARAAVGGDTAPAGERVVRARDSADRRAA